MDTWAHRWTHSHADGHTVTQMDVWMDTQAHRWTHRRIFNSFSFFGLVVFWGELMNPVANTAPHVRRALNAGCGNAAGVLSLSQHTSRFV